MPEGQTQVGETECSLAFRQNVKVNFNAVAQAFKQGINCYIHHSRWDSKYACERECRTLTKGPFHMNSPTPLNTSSLSQGGWIKNVKAHLHKKRAATHKPFGLILGGGGARGLAHVGVLRALNHLGYYPAAITGVSMGAVVGATYALNEAWYSELVNMDISGFPKLPHFKSSNAKTVLSNLFLAERAARNMYFGQGSGEASVNWGRGVLEHLTMGKNLQDGRIPIYTVATDILTGARVVSKTGNAVDAIYASSALAGVLPPLQRDGYLLVDGGYSDVAPVDTLRDIGLDIIIAIDPSQNRPAKVPKNGLQAMLRSIQIMQDAFAKRQFEQADLILRPKFATSIGAMDFKNKRHCIAAGVKSVRVAAPRLHEMVGVD